MSYGLFEFLGRRVSLRQHSRRGQIAVLLVIALPALLLSMSLCIDVGNLYLNRTWIQTAIDSGALAGAQYLPDNQAQAISTASTYSQANRVKASEIQSITVTPDGKSLTIQVARSIPCYFCLAMGEGEAYAWSKNSPANLNVTATAGIIPAGAAWGVLPIGVQYDTSYSFGSTIVLTYGMLGPGNWGALALGGTGASTYSNNLAYGYPGKVSSGDLVLTETGQMVGPTAQGMNTRISDGESWYPSGSFQSHNLADPRAVVVPMVDFTGINGSSSVPVKGFAIFWVESTDSKGNITCEFIRQAVATAIPDASATAFGASTPVLIN